MNTLYGDATLLANNLSTAIPQILQHSQHHVSVAVFPPVVWLAAVAAALNTTAITVGAQNCSDHAKGAHTGEISAAMIESAGACYVIVGHSERRKMYGESSKIVAAKAVAALSNNLTPLVCVGESLSEREQGRAWSVISEQLLAVIEACDQAQRNSLVVAYEPVWAIGSGVAATTEYIADIHARIRALLQQTGCEQDSRRMILYGGSVTPANAAEIFSLADVDGALVGGASLNADSFTAIVQSAIVQSAIEQETAEGPESC
jgi:triosephosphate isomerase